MAKPRGMPSWFRQLRRRFSKRKQDAKTQASRVDQLIEAIGSADDEGDWEDMDENDEETTEHPHTSTPRSSTHGPRKSMPHINRNLNKSPSIRRQPQQRLVIVDNQLRLAFPRQTSPISLKKSSLIRRLIKRWRKRTSKAQRVHGLTVAKDGDSQNERSVRSGEYDADQEDYGVWNRDGGDESSDPRSMLNETETGSTDDILPALPPVGSQEINELTFGYFAICDDVEGDDRHIESSSAAGLYKFASEDPVGSDEKDKIEPKQNEFSSAPGSCGLSPRHTSNGEDEARHNDTVSTPTRPCTRRGHHKQQASTSTTSQSLPHGLEPDRLVSSDQALGQNELASSYSHLPLEEDQTILPFPVRYDFAPEDLSNSDDSRRSDDGSVYSDGSTPSRQCDRRRRQQDAWYARNGNVPYCLSKRSWAASVLKERDRVSASSTDLLPHAHSRASMVSHGSGQGSWRRGDDGLIHWHANTTEAKGDLQSDMSESPLKRGNLVWEVCLPTQMNQYREENEEDLEDDLEWEDEEEVGGEDGQMVHEGDVEMVDATNQEVVDEEDEGENVGSNVHADNGGGWVDWVDEGVVDEDDGVRVDEDDGNERLGED